MSFLEVNVSNTSNVTAISPIEYEFEPNYNNNNYNIINPQIANATNMTIVPAAPASSAAASPAFEVNIQSGSDTNNASGPSDMSNVRVIETLNQVIIVNPTNSPITVTQVSIPPQSNSTLPLNATTPV